MIQGQLDDIEDSARTLGSTHKSRLDLDNMISSRSRGLSVISLNRKKYSTLLNPE